MNKVIIFIIIVFFNTVLLNAQSYNIGIKYFGLSFHPLESINYELMPLKLDPNGIFVLNVGLMASFEKYIWKDFMSIKFAQALYGDCILQFAGFSHIGFRLKIFTIGKHNLNGGIGPTLIYRKNWYNIDGYDDEFRFFNGKKGDYWQWRVLWYGGEFEYNYNLRNNIDFSVTFVPGFPDLVVFAFGVRIKK
jgi:hypothetical protein